MRTGKRYRRLDSWKVSLGWAEPYKGREGVQRAETEPAAARKKVARVGCAATEL